MRTKLALASLGLAAAASFAPLTAASAVCLVPNPTDVGPACVDPCHPVNAVLARYGAHLDCVTS